MGSNEPLKTPTMESLLDGSFYDYLYRETDFGGIYPGKELPAWAAETNIYNCHQVAALLCLDKNTRILDIGSGVGHFVRAWRAIGMKYVIGYELSREAIKISGENFIEQGCISDMPFPDDHFDLVFSASLFEHIPEQILSKSIRECFRVGKFQAHLIADEAGNDPTHINIKTVQEWGARFSGLTEDLIVIMKDPAFNFPLVLTAPGDSLPRPIHKLANQGRGEDNGNG